MDVQRFLTASLRPREKSIKVPDLADFFAEGEAPVWVVRGLTGAELGRAKDASKRSENLRALVDAVGADGSGKAEAFRKSLGLDSSEVPEDVAYRIEMLAAGSVSPEIGDGARDIAVKLAETFPTTFYQLTNEILGLTGQGAELGKPKGSGKSRKSSKP